MSSLKKCLMMIDKILIIIKNNAKRLVKISFLSLFLLVPFINVNAASISDVSAAYGYQYYDTNNTFHNYILLNY